MSLVGFSIMTWVKPKPWRILPAFVSNVAWIQVLRRLDRGLVHWHRLQLMALRRKLRDWRLLLLLKRWWNRRRWRQNSKLCFATDNVDVDVRWDLDIALSDQLKKSWLETWVVRSRVEAYRQGCTFPYPFSPSKPYRCPQLRAIPAPSIIIVHGKTEYTNQSCWYLDFWHPKPKHQQHLLQQISVVMLNLAIDMRSSELPALARAPHTTYNPWLKLSTGKKIFWIKNLLLSKVYFK